MQVGRYSVNMFKPYDFIVSAVRTYTRNCIPQCNPMKESDLIEFTEFLSMSSKLLVVTGAGISTESGLPDYRSKDVGAYARNKNFVPVQYQTFVNNPNFRKRYWLRNYLGWDNLFNLKPNNAHLAVTKLEQINKMIHLITQNVDSLHLKAGTNKVVELHGTSYRVICLGCSYDIDRLKFQSVLASHNPSIKVSQFPLNPDGDVDIGESDCNAFQVPDCPDCEGVLKPDIVFFGDNVPKKRVQFVNDLVDECDSLAVFGSSLTVQSSYRIVTKAHSLKKRIAVVNIGKTRADNLVTLKIDAKCGDVLPAALNLIGGANSIKT